MKGRMQEGASQESTNRQDEGSGGGIVGVVFNLMLGICSVKCRSSLVDDMKGKAKRRGDLALEHEGQRSGEWTPNKE